VADPDQAVATQLANIEKRTGKTLAELTRIVRESGPLKHGELRDMLKTRLGMGHGDANTLVHHVLQSDGASAAKAAGKSAADVLEDLYAGPKAALRPIHDELMKEITRFGAFEVAPKKTYVSLRRKKQFAMIGPATSSRVDVGLNMKGTPPTERLRELPPGGMCSHQVRVTRAEEVDAELIAWIRAAYDLAGP
jgi:hypothetical protein